MSVVIRRGTKLPKGDVVAEVKCQCQDYCIVKTDVGSYGLFLSDRIFHALKDVVAEEFLCCKFVDYKDGHYFSGKRGNNISSAHLGPFAERYSEMLDFCVAFGRSKEVIGTKKLTEVIYVEEYDLMLPVCLEGADNIQIDKLLGAWISDGLLISVNDFAKLCLVVDWLSEEEIQRAVETAGFVVNKESCENSRQADIGSKKADRKEKSNLGVRKTSSDNEDSVSKKTITAKAPFILPGRKQLTQYFNEEIIDFFANQDKYEQMGVHSVSATLLYGKPGCGKTYAVEQLAKYLGFPIYEINSSSVASTYIHETSKKISDVFKKAIDSAPSVLILDEFEAYLSSRNGSPGQTHHTEEVDEFLRNIPKAIDSKVVIFAMTNTIDLIDAAVLRTGRFDNKIEVGMPSKEEIVAVLKNTLSKTQVEDDVNLEPIASKLLDHPLSDVAYVVRQAIRLAVRSDKEKIDNETLASAIEQLGVTEHNKPKKHRPIGFATNAREDNEK